VRQRFGDPEPRRERAMTHGRDTVVRCKSCGSIYAAYYTAGEELVTPGGEYCPNCDNEQFSELSAQGE
jgi:uncharacterized OB-fold protein